MDRVFAEVLAYDGARPEFDAALRVVDEFALVEAVDLRRADVQTRLRVARPADVCIHSDERFLVELELVQADPLVHAQRLRCILFRRFGHRWTVENRGQIINRWGSSWLHVIREGTQVETFYSDSLAS